MRYYDERQLAIDCAVEEATEVVAVQSYKKGLLQAAKYMLADGLAPARVTRITKLPEKQIKALR